MIFRIFPFMWRIFPRLKKLLHVVFLPFIFATKIIPYTTLIKVYQKEFLPDCRKH